MKIAIAVVAAAAAISRAIESVVQAVEKEIETEKEREETEKHDSNEQYAIYTVSSLLGGMSKRKRKCSRILGKDFQEHIQQDVCECLCG